MNNQYDNNERTITYLVAPRKLKKKAAISCHRLYNVDF